MLPSKSEVRKVVFLLGKKLAVKIRGDLPPGDYDVSVCFAGRMLHGTLPIEVVDKKELSDRDNYHGELCRANLFVI